MDSFNRNNSVGAGLNSKKLHQGSKLTQSTNYNNSPPKNSVLETKKLKFNFEIDMHELKTRFDEI